MEELGERCFGAGLCGNSLLSFGRLNLGRFNYLSRVIFAGGGTGGHLYPGLAVADELKLSGHEILFVGTRHGVEARVVPERGYAIEFVRAKGLSGKPKILIKALWETLWGFFQSLKLMRRFKPDLVVGTGGYVSAPAVLAGKVSGVPVVVLEQNAVPGKATRVLARWAERVCVSFPESARHFAQDKVECTGNPVRRELLAVERAEARAAEGISEGSFCLLVTGASQGASSINRALMRSLVRWRDKPWTVLHLTGPGHFEEISAEAEGLTSGGKLDYRAFAYREDIGQLYGCADLVLSRAGATTIAELTCLGLPAILVPYPYAGGHQRYNAKAMEDHGAARLVEDGDIEAELPELVEKLVASPACVEGMASASKGLGAPQAVKTIASICERYSSLACRRSE